MTDTDIAGRECGPAQKLAATAREHGWRADITVGAGEWLGRQRVNVLVRGYRGGDRFVAQWLDSAWHGHSSSAPPEPLGTYWKAETCYAWHIGQVPVAVERLKFAELRARIRADRSGGAS